MRQRQKSGRENRAFILEQIEIKRSGRIVDARRPNAAMGILNALKRFQKRLGFKLRFEKRNRIDVVRTG